MRKNTYRIMKALLFVATFAMIAYLSPGMSSFLFFSSLFLILSLGRSVPTIAVAAVLLGMTFPIVGALVAAALALYVLMHPTRRLQGQPG